METIFNSCELINNLLFENKESEARDELIKLLDYHEANRITYSPLVNHLIRETGLYPYIQTSTANWQEKVIYEAFKVNTGDNESKTLHREQSLLLKELLSGKDIAVSAPTSFGKSFIIDSFIKINSPKNVVIIVPTISLTDETRRRIYKKFSNEYKIITTSDEKLSEKNIFIFPQERIFSYLDKISTIDILIVDEFYKSSKYYDDERSSSLIKAIIFLKKKAKQKYFLAPNIESIKDNPFTEDMTFMYMDFKTVFLKIHDYQKEINKNNEAKTNCLLKILNETKNKSLIYAGTYANIDRISTIIQSNFDEKNRKILNDFSDWLGKNYDYNWDLTNLIRRGTGVHNGRLHRALSQIQVRLFEDVNGLDNIVSTSSIVEGVNTSAGNVILWQNKNGNRNLNDFTYRNIIGRGGRMFRHFIGHIFILDTPLEQNKIQLEIPFPEEILGSLDEQEHSKILTTDQIAKIILYKEEMNDLLGVHVYEELRQNSFFQSSNSDLIKNIAIDMTRSPDDWHCLACLNGDDESIWNNALYKVINMLPGKWDAKYSDFVEFIKVIKFNWIKTIPEMLSLLEDIDLGINDFFKLERNVSFKFSSLINDINTLIKFILTDRNINISRFATACSYAFLPPAVFKLEEYGLPRMVSRKIHLSGIMNLADEDLTISDAIDYFKNMGLLEISKNVELDEFDLYFLEYFYEGIS